MSIISTGTTSGTGLIHTSNTDGTLVIKTNDDGSGGTTAVTVRTDQTVAVIAGSVSAPGLSTSGDANTGLYFSAADTVDITTGGTQRGQFDSSGNFKFNSGYGSAATAYGCRAWVNFNGTGTVAIRASGNVSSITDNGTGDYTVNFSTAMPDANYTTGGNSSLNATGSGSARSANEFNARDVAAGNVRLYIADGTSGSLTDAAVVNASIHR